MWYDSQNTHERGAVSRPFFDGTFGSVFRTVSVDFVTKKIVQNSPATGVGARRCTVLPADLRVEGTRRELSREVGGREVPYLK